jgi:hypothetical protein
MLAFLNQEIKGVGSFLNMTRGQANAILAEILQPINESVGIKESPFVNRTFGPFVERVYSDLVTHAEDSHHRGGGFPGRSRNNSRSEVRTMIDWPPID